MNLLWKKQTLQQLRVAAKARFPKGWNSARSAWSMGRVVRYLLGMGVLGCALAWGWHASASGITVRYSEAKWALANLLILLPTAALQMAFTQKFCQGREAKQLLLAPVGKDFWWRFALRAQRNFLIGYALATALVAFRLAQVAPQFFTPARTVQLWLNELVVSVALAWITLRHEQRPSTWLFLLGYLPMAMGLANDYWFSRELFDALGKLCATFSPISWPVTLGLSNSWGQLINLGGTLALSIWGWKSYRHLREASTLSCPLDDPHVSAEYWEQVAEFLEDKSEDELLHLDQVGALMQQSPSPTHPMPQNLLAKLLREHLESEPAAAPKSPWALRWWMARLSAGQRRIVDWFSDHKSPWLLPPLWIGLATLLIAPAVWFFNGSPRVTELSNIYLVVLVLGSYLLAHTFGSITKSLCAGERIGPTAVASTVALFPLPLQDLWAVHRWRILARLGSIFPVALLQALMFCWFNAWTSPYSKSSAAWPWGFEPSCARFYAMVLEGTWLKACVTLFIYLVFFQKTRFAIEVSSMGPRKFGLRAVCILIRLAFWIGLLALPIWAASPDATWSKWFGRMTLLAWSSLGIGNLLLWWATRKGDWVRDNA